MHYSPPMRLENDLIMEFFGKTTLRNMCKGIVGMSNINAQELQDIKILKTPIEDQLSYTKTLEEERWKKKK